ncbi:hypothetical protein IPF86_01360 [Candidatus Nomurabacteria bacterium]|jgi:glycosyltransferase involved in cell wall biosynthesis|nr:MAG: hypothetical protein IPF86_01360 [Candidatus Nomurabacteria bacterium]
MKKKLLLNWLYYRPVGHAIEPLKLAKGYVLANKNLDVYLILNSDSPIEIAKACPWIKKVYAISLQEVAKDGIHAISIQKIPKKWDYVSTDNRARHFNPAYDQKDLVKAHQLLSTYLTAKTAKGYLEQSGPHESSILPIVANPKITLPIPKKAKLFANRFIHKGPKICIMLGGSAGLKQSPSIDMWLKICQALYKSIPNLKIYFTGISKSSNGRTSTKDFTLDDVDFLIKRLPNAESVYDVGLWNQIAFISKCDVFISPHTGFAFMPPLVGAPWLEIATCRWPAYFFNDMPFYSVLPECGSYPSLMDNDKKCNILLNKNKKALCVSDKLIQDKIPEIVKGVKLLLNKSFTYDKAIALHLNRIKKDYDIKRFFFFGGIQGITHKNEVKTKLK